MNNLATSVEQTAMQTENQPPTLVLCCVCASTDHRPYFNEDGHQIVRCRQCGHIFENPLDLGGITASYVGDGNWLQDLSDQSIEDHPRYSIYKFGHDILHKNKISSGPILEIGCSRGYFLRYLIQQGYSTFGIEPGPDAGRAEIAIQKRIFRGWAEKYAPTEKFKAIFFLDVLEHIPNPHDLLKQVHSWLADDGIIVIMVPNFWLQRIRVVFARFGLRPFKIVLSAGNHINHFTPRTLKRLLAMTGFARIVIENSPADLQYIRGLPKYWSAMKRTYWFISAIIKKITGLCLAGNITAVAHKF